MEWIQVLSKSEEEKPVLKGSQQFTLYDHNAVTKYSADGRTFHCLLNCKRLNRIFHTVSLIQGDLGAGKVSIKCWIFDQESPIHGKWQYQKIQLNHFAFRYNQRSNSNIVIRTNPLNGEVCVTLSYLCQPSILSSDRLKETMSDLCHMLGEKSEMIFNTMLEIIMGRESNQPYLKSISSSNSSFPRYMKLDRLLDKIKSLIATSSFYKIRSDISSAHKNRSYFKKIYLPSQKKYSIDFKVIQMALLYEPKFSSKYLENEKIRKQKRVMEKNKYGYFIKDYIQLEEKNQIQFAKHLNQGSEKKLQEKSFRNQPVTSLSLKQETQMFEIKYEAQIVMARGRHMSEDQYSHQLKMLELMQVLHPNMMTHLIPSNIPAQFKGWIFYLHEEEIPLIQFLRKNSRTISLSTKLQIMGQICSFMQFLHKKHIGYFIQLQNIFITRGLQVKICGFRRSYQVSQNWTEDKKDTEQIKVLNFILKQHEMIQFPYRYIRVDEPKSEKCDIMSLGVCLYRVLMDKFPFFEKIEEKEWTEDQWMKMWTVETEYFLTRGGQLVKIIGHLVLKCMQLASIASRPYVQWLLVILCQIRTSLNGLY